jgi:hypothetical protein
MDIAELKKAFIPGLVMSLGILAITTLAGATVAGILVGALTAGAGAVPAAVAGGELGLDAGFLILDAMGIGFLLREVFGGISEFANNPDLPLGGQGHILYEQWRSLPADSPQAQTIADQSKQYYDAFRK